MLELRQRGRMLPSGCYRDGQGRIWRYIKGEARRCVNDCLAEARWYCAATHEHRCGWCLSWRGMVEGGL